MTPLARRYLKHLMDLEQEGKDVPFEIDAFCAEVRCFDCTGIYDIVTESWGRIENSVRAEQKFPDSFGFLPAANCFIEWRSWDVQRHGCHLLEIGENKWHARYSIVDENTKQFSCDLQGALLCIFDQCIASGDVFPDAFSSGFVDDGPVSFAVSRTTRLSNTFRLLCSIGLINTPKIGFRENHRSHRGFAKKLSNRLGRTGRFPLKDWTEITLNVSPPPASGDEREKSGQQGSTRALHFVRAHLRLWNGSFIHVKSHWRGDANKGIRRSTYKVQP